MRSTIAFAAALAALGSPALAQSPAAPAQAADARYPVVITPARLRQSLSDVPGSVSIITGEMLRQ